MTDANLPSSDLMAGAKLEAEGERIRVALKKADELAAYIIAHALSEELSTHIEISFEPHDAAMIANLADQFQTLRKFTAKGRG